MKKTLFFFLSMILFVKVSCVQDTKLHFLQDYINNINDVADSLKKISELDSLNNISDPDSLIQIDNKDSVDFSNNIVNSILNNISEPNFSNRFISINYDDIKDFNICNIINEKIKNLSETGGGTLILSDGDYLCKGPIIFKNNVNLHLSEKCRLIFSQNPEDYLPVVFVRWEGTEAYNYSPFIYAVNLENIAITGKGIIDGNSTDSNSFRSWKGLQSKDQNKLREMGRDGVPVEQRIFGKGSYLRPQLIHFINCKNILLEDFKVINGSFWLIQPTYCKNITIRNLLVESRFINNDGVDIDSSTDIIIENCQFNVGDDFVAIKSGRDQDAWRVNKPSKNIIVRNCSSDQCLNGISIGSELSGGVENIFIENLTFNNISYYGIQLKSNKDRGGYLKNVYIKGIKMNSVKIAISLTNQYHSYSGGDYPTSFEDIAIENFYCKYASEMGISLEGLIEKPIKNISLKNIKIERAQEKTFIKNVENLIYDNVEIGN